MKVSTVIHHLWSLTNMGGLFFTAAVYVGLLLYSSTYTPAPCQSFTNALAGDSVAATDILESDWFRIWELVSVLLQVGLLLGYFTLHGIMAFYEHPREALKFLVLSAEIFFGWLVFGFRVFGLQSTDLSSSCTEVDVAPEAYWVIRASSMLFSPLIGVVALQIAAHGAILYMEHHKKEDQRVLKGLKLAIMVFEIVLGAFGMAMGICYGIWAKNPWVRAVIWVAVSTVVFNIYAKFKWIAIWEVEAEETRKREEEERYQYEQELKHIQLQEETDFGHTGYPVDSQQYAKNAKYDEDFSPISPNTNAYSQPPSAQLRNF